MNICMYEYFFTLTTDGQNLDVQNIQYFSLSTHNTHTHTQKYKKQQITFLE